MPKKDPGKFWNADETKKADRSVKRISILYYPLLRKALAFFIRVLQVVAFGNYVGSLLRSRLLDVTQRGSVAWHPKDGCEGDYYVGRYSLNEKILQYDSVKINELSFVRLKVFFILFYVLFWNFIQCLLIICVCTVSYSKFHLNCNELVSESHNLRLPDEECPCPSKYWIT